MPLEIDKNMSVNPQSDFKVSKGEDLEVVALGKDAVCNPWNWA